MGEPFDFSKHKSDYDTIDWQTLTSKFNPEFHKPFAKALDQL